MTGAGASRPGAIPKRTGAALALLVVGLGVAVAVGFTGFRSDSRVVVIGAHTTTVSPTFDGYATLDFGPLVPRVRVATDEPFGLGVRIDVGDTDVGSVNELIQRDALIASQPDGEVRRIRATTTAMAVAAAVRGLGAGVLAALLLAALWRLVGPQRRTQLAAGARRVVTEPRPRPLLAGAGLVAATAFALAASVLPGAGAAESASGQEEWVRVPELFPDLALDDRLRDVEVSTGGATRGGVELVDSALATYRQSVEFYGALAQSVADVAGRIRQPLEDETVGLLVADRHDNIGMDPVARAVADAGGATFVIDAGDDTSSGGDWETFSINSLADAFDGFDVVVVAGNHDSGDAVPAAYADAGFTVLSGEPETVAGIRFIGDSDPRSSGLTAIRTEGAETVEEQGARLASAACEDGDVDVVVVHSPATGLAAAESGCVDLVVSGHVHRQLGPDTAYPVAGRPTTTYSNGTTGGAAYAFALGAALRRDAQVTLVTFRDGRPVGLQPVGFATGGIVEVAPYQPIATGVARAAVRGPS